MECNLAKLDFWPMLPQKGATSSTDTRGRRRRRIDSRGQPYGHSSCEIGVQVGGTIKFALKEKDTKQKETKNPRIF